MHRSRLSTLLIDVPTHRAESSAAFWSAALGVQGRNPPGEPQFTTLHGAIPGLVTAVQSVDDEARYHVDIETDDVAAEVARLQGTWSGRGVELAGLSYPPSSRRSPALRHPRAHRAENLRRPGPDLAVRIS